MRKVFEAIEVAPFYAGVCIDDKTDLITIEDHDGQKWILAPVEDTK